jgi:N-sulfoglucosamine sulfohydrolase
MPSPIRNVLFLIADDWSPLAACYGHLAIRTPQIDRFAQRATIFDYGFCTSPSCAVSRACILTGHYAHTHGQYGHSHGLHGFRTHETMRSLPGLVAPHGIASACIGKRHFEPTSVYPFTEFHNHYDTRDVADLADCTRDFIRRHDAQPWFIYVGFGDPHRHGDGFANHYPHRGVVEQVYRPEEVIVPSWLPDTPEVRADLADYYQAVSRFDWGIGLQLQALAESGHADDTLVVVTTDHGMPFPGAKASPYDSGHRCPLLLYAPGHSRPALRSPALVNWQDFLPTFLAWQGVPIPADLPGRSLLPLLADPAPTGWDHTWYSHCFHEVTNYYPYRVLRLRRYKYVLHLAPGLPLPLPTDLFRSRTWQSVRDRRLAQVGSRDRHRMLHHAPEELYDLEQDPDETTNLADRPEHAALLADCRARMTAWRRTTRDPWLEVSFQNGDLSFDPDLRE